MMEMQIQQFYQFLELFKTYLDNPRYQKNLYDFGLSITLDESDKILSYVLSYISFNPGINQHPNFEKCFLFFLNKRLAQSRFFQGRVKQALGF